MTALSNSEWMDGFNTDGHLSDVDIIANIDRIDWAALTRQLPEGIIDRFYWKVVNWTPQLYGASRTVEFIMRYRSKFNWEDISANPPSWFTEYHAYMLEDDINWFALTPHIAGYSMGILSLHDDDLDWDWISTNYIVDEAFAIRFINHINWNLDDLDVSNLSTEFLYELDHARQEELNMRLGVSTSMRYSRFSILLESMPLRNLKRNDKIRIGGSITLMFFRKNLDRLDIDELKKRALLTADMQSVIDAMD